VFTATLKENHSLQLSRRSTESAERTASLSNAGLLPTASLTAGLTYTNGEQRASSGSVTDQEKTTAQTGIQFNYTLFDGFYTINNYRSNQKRSELSELQTRALVDLTLLQSATAYMAVQSAQRSVILAQQSCELSNKRVSFAQNRIGYGQNSSLDLLSAQVDLRSDSTALFRAEEQLHAAQIALNQLMGKTEPLAFTVDQSISLDSLPPLEELLTRAVAYSPTLKAAESEKVVSELTHSLAKSAFFPRLNIGAGYGLSNSREGFGIPTENSPTGQFTGSLSLNWSLIDGRAFTTYRNAESLITDSDIKIDRERIAIESELRTLYGAWESAKLILSTEEQTRSLSNELQKRSLEQYRLGQIQSVTLRESQLAYFRTEQAVQSAQSAIKLNELKIRRLAGML